MNDATAHRFGTVRSFGRSGIIEMHSQAQEVRSNARHTAPAGPACLNNNAPHRWGRPESFVSLKGTRASAPRSRTEASRSSCI
jgi:hypothetical protein